MSLSIPPAWPHVRDFFGTPLVIEPSRGRLSGGDGAYRRLAEGERQPAEEAAQAARHVRSLLPERLQGDVSVGWRFVPSTQLGDVFVHRWLGRDHLAVYLLDVSGHGVGSSLLAVSAANLLSAGSLP